MTNRGKMVPRHHGNPRAFITYPARFHALPLVETGGPARIAVALSLPHQLPQRPVDPLAVKASPCVAHVTPAVDDDVGGEGLDPIRLLHAVVPVHQKGIG